MSYKNMKSIYREELVRAKELFKNKNPLIAIKEAVDMGYYPLMLLQIVNCQNTGCLLFEKERVYATISLSINGNWSLRKEEPIPALEEKLSRKSGEETDRPKLKSFRPLLSEISQESMFDVVGRRYKISYPSIPPYESLKYINYSDLKPIDEKDNLVTMLEELEEQGFTLEEIIQINNAKDRCCMMLRRNKWDRKSVIKNQKKDSWIDVDISFRKKLLYCIREIIFKKE